MDIKNSHYILTTEGSNIDSFSEIKTKWVKIGQTLKGLLVKEAVT